MKCAMQCQKILFYIFFSVAIFCFFIPSIAWNMGSGFGHYILSMSVRFVHTIIYAIWFFFASLIALLINLLLAPTKLVINAVNIHYSANLLGTNVGIHFDLADQVPAWIMQTYNADHFTPRLLQLNVWWIDPPTDVDLFESVKEWWGGITDSVNDWFGEGWRRVEDGWNDFWKWLSNLG